MSLQLHLQSKMEPRVSYPAATLCHLPLTAGRLSNNWLFIEEWRGGGGFSVLNAVWNPDTTDLGRFSRRPTTVRSDMNSTAVRDVAPCSPVQAYGHFGGNYWFHHQDGKLASKHIFSLLGSFLDPYGLKQHASPKRCYSPTRLHGVKTETHIVSALRCFSQNNVTMNCLQ